MVDHDQALAELGSVLRAHREISRLSLRALAQQTEVSDSYLSQVERGLCKPSPDVLRAIADGLRVNPESLFQLMGWLPRTDATPTFASTLEAIAADPALNATQKSALAQTYQSMAGDQ